MRRRVYVKTYWFVSGHALRRAERSGLTTQGLEALILGRQRLKPTGARAACDTTEVVP